MAYRSPYLVVQRKSKPFLKLGTRAVKEKLRNPCLFVLAHEHLMKPS